MKQFVVKSERFYNHRLVNGNARLLTDPSAQTSIVSNTGPLDHGFDFLAICTKIREVSGTSAAYKSDNSFRAVAKLGIAPGSGPGGRGFKSHQPDSVDAVSVAALVSRTEIPKKQAFGTNAPTL